MDDNKLPWMESVEKEILDFETISKTFFVNPEENPVHVAALKLVKNLRQIVAAEKERLCNDRKDRDRRPEGQASDLGQKVFSNSVILLQIFSHLPTKDLLKSCRLVNKLWEEEATRTLLSSNYELKLTVYFKWNSWHDDFEHSRITHGTLAEFHHDVWKTSRKFPCSHLTFKMGNLGSRECSPFLSECGKDIKSLTLKRTDANRITQMETYRRVFLEWLPNLKNFTIEDPEDERDRYSMHQPKESLFDPEDPSSRTFPNLRTLRIIDRAGIQQRQNNSSAFSMGKSQLVRDIYTRAPNLKLIPRDTMSYSEEMVQTIPFQPVGSLSWNFSVQNLDTFIGFARGRPKLKKFHFEILQFLRSHRNTVPTLVTAFNNILQGSSDTLTDLKGVEALQDLSPLDIPVLPKIRGLTIELTESQTNSVAHPGRGLLLPENYRLTTVFPSLENLAILADEEISRDSEQDRSIFHLPENSHPNVNLLFLDYHYYRFDDQLHFMREVSLRFCNLKKLALHLRHFLRDVPNAMTAVWQHLPQLEQLVIHVVVYETMCQTIDEYLVASVDSAMTGLTFDQCKMLKENDQVIPEFYQLEPRENVSLLNMSNLKSFCICNLLPTGKPLFSKVTTFYGLGPMWERQQMEFSMTHSKRFGQSFCPIENCAICAYPNKMSVGSFRGVY